MSVGMGADDYDEEDEEAMLARALALSEAPEFKFPTELFFLAHRAVHSGTMVAVQVGARLLTSGARLPTPGARLPTPGARLLTSGARLLTSVLHRCDHETNRPINPRGRTGLTGRG